MDKLIEIILNYVDPNDEITGKSSLRNDCGLTSFDAICAMNEVCTVFGVKIEYADFRACSTVEDLYNTIERKRQNA